MMILHSGITCPFSHRCRIVLFEKGMDFEIKDVDVFNKPENLVLMNPYNQVPVLEERELFSHVQVLENATAKKALDEARTALSEGLIQLAPVFQKNKFILGHDFSLADVALAPLLWRLDHYQIKLPKSAAPLLKYGENIFRREGFIAALTPSEKAMRR